MDAEFFNVCNDLFQCYSTFSFVVAFLPEVNLYLYRFICTHYFLDRVEFFLFSCTNFPNLPMAVWSVFANVSGMLVS